MDIRAVIGGGFRIIRNRPLAVAAWFLIFAPLFAAMTLLMHPMIAATMQAMSDDSQGQVATVGAMTGRFLLFFLLLLVAHVILFAAAQRAVLQPQRHAFFYLRLGLDELRLAALTIVFVVGLYVVVFALMVVLGVLIVITMEVSGASTSGILALSLGLIDVVTIIGFTAFYYTRLGLAFPLTLMRGRIIIGEAWRISRGRFWPLLVASLVIWILIFVLWMVVLGVTSGAYFAELARSGGDPVAMQKAAQAQMARFGGLTGTAAVLWALGGLIGTLTITLWGGAAATAAQQLTLNSDEMAETFA